jgi:hypothetical protein
VPPSCGSAHLGSRRKTNLTQRRGARPVGHRCTTTKKCRRLSFVGHDRCFKKQSQSCGKNKKENEIATPSKQICGCSSFVYGIGKSIRAFLRLMPKLMTRLRNWLQTVHLVFVKSHHNSFAIILCHTQGARVCNIPSKTRNPSQPFNPRANLSSHFQHVYTLYLRLFHKAQMHYKTRSLSEARTFWHQVS